MSLAHVLEVCPTRQTLALQPLFDRSADASVNNDLLDELPEQRVLLRDGNNGLPQEFPFFLGRRAMRTSVPRMS